MKRKRPKPGLGPLRLGLAAAAAVLAAGFLLIWGWQGFPFPDGTEDAAATSALPVDESQGVKLHASIKDGRLAVYDGSGWSPKFWSGVNLGATTPGHTPGHLSPKKEDYKRWLEQIKEMNADVIRIYTILPPYFYEALAEFNAGRPDPLYFFQGIWSPEEELYADGLGTDAFDPHITETFQNEIRDAVRAVHGDLNRRYKEGHASGRFRHDVSPYLLGYIVGTEWHPPAVQATNDANAGMKPFEGSYFKAASGSSPFESWLAQMLDTLAREEMKYGWQHPVAFTNWVTTDPLSHPNEPNPQEDMVSVDPMHIVPSEAWQAGYFAAYHIYPYYPDSLRFEEKYLTYVDARGAVNPYAGYLRDLREHHAGIPLIVAEYGVSSSRGLAHYGPLGRDQGMHTEQEQGKINTELYRSIYDEKYDGAILFSWHDEWFKTTWNTSELEIPANRRHFWRNTLTNEEHFGVIAVEPGRSPDDLILLDGKTDDWQRKKVKRSKAFDTFTMTVTHDEAFLYLLLEKKEGAWQIGNDVLTIGFDTIRGGSASADRAPGHSFSGGLEFLLRMNGEDDARIWVNSAYDQHTWLNGAKKGYLPWDEELSKAEKGLFLPWKLLIGKPLYLPQSQTAVEPEEVEMGLLRKGITDPNDPRFDNLADWYADGPVLEIRLPWMLLGFTDPSSRQVWSYPYEAGTLKTETAKSIRIEPHAETASQPPASKPVVPLEYEWDKWNKPTYHERKKVGYDMMREAFREFDVPKDG